MCDKNGGYYARVSIKNNNGVVEGKKINCTKRTDMHLFIRGLHDKSCFSSLFFQIRWDLALFFFSPSAFRPWFKCKKLKLSTDERARTLSKRVTRHSPSLASFILFSNIFLKRKISYLKNFVFHIFLWWRGIKRGIKKDTRTRTQEKEDKKKQNNKGGNESRYFLFQTLFCVCVCVPLFASFCYISAAGRSRPSFQSVRLHTHSVMKCVGMIFQTLGLLVRDVENGKK